jgi:flagellar capping protein FliD
MTGEDIERAIEFLLKSQATLGGQVAGLAEQVGEVNRIISEQAQSQSQLNGALTRAITDLAESQRQTDTRIAEVEERSVRRYDDIDARLDRMIAAAAAADARIAETAARADARIAEAEERNSRRYDELDARLDRLVGVVERLAGGRGAQ